MSGVVLLDRDGVIVEPVWDPTDERFESPLRAADVLLVPGAASALRRLDAAGRALAVVSNQPAAAKGKATLSELERIHERTVALLAAEGVTIPCWKYCHHHPDGVVAALSGPCDCRKPAPALLLQAAHCLGAPATGGWMIGDSDADVLAGEAAGCRTMLIEHAGTAHRRTLTVRPDVAVTDLAAAADRVLAMAE